MDAWVLDGRRLEDLGMVLFLDFPHFLEPMSGDTQEVDFAQAEWQATLTSMLWRSPERVLNGRWLIGNPWLQRNKNLFLSQLWQLGWPCSNFSPNQSEQRIAWGMISKFGFETAPVSPLWLGGELSSASLITTTQVFLHHALLDTLFLKFSITTEAVSLEGTYLLPPDTVSLALLQSAMVLLNGG